MQVVREGIPVTVILCHCMCTFFLLVGIIMSEQVFPSAVVQHAVVKSVMNENVKPAEILMRLRAQCDEIMLSRTQDIG
jgi:hypothetical protein